MFTSSLGSMRYADNIETGLINRLKKVGGLTFLKDFNNNTGTLNADYAVGSPTATYTATRSSSAPATYVDSSGVLNLVTTSNVGRNQKGYYDTSGFASQSGLMMEAAGTNLLTRTDGTALTGQAWTGWSVSSGSITGSYTLNANLATSLSNIGSSYTQSVQYTGVAGDTGGKTINWGSPSTGAGSVLQNESVTASIWVRSLTGNSGVSIRLQITEINSGGTDVTFNNGSDFASSITSQWKKFAYNVTTSNVACDRVRLTFNVFSIEPGDLVDFEIYAPQLEKNPYATSWIPTAASSLSRGAEVLKYETAGNRTANEETIFIKFAPSSDVKVYSPTVTRRLLGNDGSTRRIANFSSDTAFNFDPNATDSPTAVIYFNISPLANTSYTIAGVAKHSSPYASTYSNGTLLQNNTTTDWTNPTFGTYFGIGVNSDGSGQLAGIIQSVAIFNRALSASEVAYVTKLMQAV